MSAILFSRAIGPVAIPVVMSEAPESVLEITEIPLEDGSKATDHAHSAPFRISLDIAAETLAVTYQALVAWQKMRAPFVYVSGFAVHTNLLIKRISAERSSEYGKLFRGKIDLQEVLIVASASAPGDGGGSQSAQSKEGKGGDNKPGGKNSRRSAPPSSSRSSDAATKNRAAGTVNRSDARTTPVPPAKTQSIAKQLGFGI